MVCGDGFDVVVNKPATSAYRAPGATNAAFAAETVVDELCEKLNLDALDWKYANPVRYNPAPRSWCADLTQHPLPSGRFDLIVVSRYLQRDLFPAVRSAIAPGGVVLYETFTTAQRALGTGPTSADHLLEPGELRARFDVDGWDVLFCEETLEPEAVARLAARKN